MSKTRAKPHAYVPSNGPSIGLPRSQHGTSNTALSASVEAQPEEPGFLDSLSEKYGQYNRWSGKKDTGDGLCKGAGLGRVLAGAEAVKPLRGPLRAVGGVGRMVKAANSDEGSFASLATSLGRGALEAAVGVTETASPFIQSSAEAAKSMPILGGVLGGVKAIDSLMNATNEEGMSVMNGLDLGQGLASVGSAFYAQVPGMSAIGGSNLSSALALKGGALTAGGSLLGAGLAGYKLGGYIADHTAADEMMGDGMTAASDAVLGKGAGAEYFGGGLMEAGAKWATGEADFQKAIDGTMGAGTLADAFGWLPGT